MATTPWPPAAQMEIRPALAGARLVQHLRQLGHDPAAGRGERVPGRQRRAVDVELRAVDRAQRGVEPELALAERRVLPRLQRREHGRGERLVDLVEVEVLQASGRCGPASPASRRPAPSAGPRRRARSRRRRSARRPGARAPAGPARRPTRRRPAGRRRRRRSAGSSWPPSSWRPSPLPNTGLSVASFSTVESGRRFWSRVSPR